MESISEAEQEEQIRVLNQSPTIHKTPYRIAIVGEAPGFDEQQARQPFVGQSGRLLEGCLQKVGIARRACFIGNITQFRPPNNVISRFAWNGPEIQDGLRELQTQLATFKPNLVVLLGNAALKAAHDPTTNHPLVPKAYRHSITAERGSVFRCQVPESPFFGFKCMGTIHPAAVLRQFHLLVLLQFDLSRALEEGRFPEVKRPQRNLLIDLPAHAIVDRLNFTKAGTLVSIDIEGGIVAEKKTRRKDPETGEYVSEYKPSCVPCLAISTDPSEAYIINFGDHSAYEERQILDALSRLCWDPFIPKLFQNGVYDTFVMWWMFRILVRNHCHDTMLSGWELYPELPKALGTQASLYTKEPYWKSDRKTDDPRTFLRYCCTDAAVTLEIHQKQMAVMTPAQRAHYDFNCSLLPILLYAELRGIRWDHQKAQELSDTFRVKLAEPWARIQTHAAKNGAPEHKTNKGEYCNPNSPKQMVNVLYNILGYPAQYKMQGGQKTNTKTCDKLALLMLLKKFPNDTFLGDILLWRKLIKLQQQAETKTDKDGRVRCSYNPVGTVTGRLSSSTAPTGTGMNLQTVTKVIRVLCRADEGHYFFQIDLEGADGWTVACRCAELVGDDTMLEDYRFGIKPANVIALTYMLNDPATAPLFEDIVTEHGNAIAKWPREVIKVAAKEHVDKDGWLYFASKRVQHGSNYGLGKIQMSNQILQDSYKLAPAPILLPPKDCELLKRLYLGGRYVAVQSWQSWIKSQLLKHGSLACASGHIRRFFGRRNDASTINAALSHEPQANTTYATNLGLRRLWSDPDNRDDSGRLIVEPLHQVHDAICGQFPIEREEWAKKKLREWMHNPITIGKETLVIPYEGEYGDSWGKMDKGTIYMND